VSTRYGHKIRGRNIITLMAVRVYTIYMKSYFNITFNYVSKNCPVSVINRLTVVFVLNYHARVLTTRVYSGYPSNVNVGKSGSLNIINFVRVQNTHRQYTEIPVSHRAQGCIAVFVK
jgi:hypothetical protein